MYIHTVPLQPGMPSPGVQLPGHSPLPHFSNAFGNWDTPPSSYKQQGSTPILGGLKDLQGSRFRPVSDHPILLCVLYTQVSYKCLITYHNFLVQVHSHLLVSDPSQTTASCYGTPPDCRCKILLPSPHSSTPQICTLLPSTKLFISFQGQLVIVNSSSLLLAQALTQMPHPFQAKCRQTGMATMYLIPLWGTDISSLPLHLNFQYQAITMFLSAHWPYHQR